MAIWPLPGSTSVRTGASGTVNRPAMVAVPTFTWVVLAVLLQVPVQETVRFGSWVASVPVDSTWATLLGGLVTGPPRSEDFTGAVKRTIRVVFVSELMIDGVSVIELPFVKGAPGVQPLPWQDLALLTSI